MAVVSVRERFNGRDGTFAAYDELTTTRTWLVTTDAKADTALSIYGTTSGSLPRYLEPHPLNYFYTCRRLQITQIQDSATAWEATATYATAPMSQDEQDRSQHENPINRPTRTTTEGVQREKYVNKDRDGIAFTNSAGDYFPAQVVDDDRVILSLTKNVASRSAEIFNFSNSLNDSDYTVDGWTISQGCGKIGRFRYSEPQEENGFTFYVLTAEIQVLNESEAWDISLLDEGFTKLNGSRREKILILNEDGDLEAPSDPQPLDGLGDTLEPSDPQYGDGGGVFRSWHYYREMDWSQLPF